MKSAAVELIMHFVKLPHSQLLPTDKSVKFVVSQILVSYLFTNLTYNTVIYI